MTTLDKETVPSFAATGLPQALVDALAERSIVEPTPIQAQAIPAALAGRDVCGKAKTGSGKTLAFGLPMLVALPKGTPGKPAGVVLVPTRELATQVCEALESLAVAVGHTITTVYGGVPMPKQIKAIEKGVDLIVATPGRLIDLVDRGAVDLSSAAEVVVDEADRMADMGFQPQVEWLLRRTTGRKRTMLFSATLDHEVNTLVSRYLSDPVLVDVAESDPTVEAMSHLFLLVHEMDRDKVLAAIINHAPRTMVFCSTKRGSDRVARNLRELGVHGSAIHGDLHQRDREKTLAKFSEGKLAALVATDVAARGLHVDDVPVVVHYDPSDDHKGYLHRSGRTARAGSSGVAVTLLLWNQELDVRRLKRRLGIEGLPIVEVFSNDPRLADLLTFAKEVASEADGPGIEATGQAQG